MTEALLEIGGIEKAFGLVKVLRGVSLVLARGEVHALLGENGAGKSTLMRILLGIERADGGTIRLSGEPYRPRSAGDARRRGVVMVPQERTLCPDLTVEENIVLGLEPASFGVIRRRDARAIAERVLALVTVAGRRIPLDVRVRELGVADRQLVEIARALAQGGADKGGAAHARVLVLDEPTSSLGAEGAARLFERVRALSEAGLAIVLVTHFLGDVRAHADRYTVLRDGTVQGAGDAKTTPPEQIVHEMLGRELEAARREVEKDAADSQREHHEGEVLLEVSELAGAIKPKKVTFTLRRGEILGIAGIVGSGRTELFRAIVGLDRPRSGRITSRARVGLLSEDRGGEGLMLTKSISDNVTLSRSGPFFVDPRKLHAEGSRWIKELAIRASGEAQRAGELSGGNQQKVQIARLLREDYDVLLVDEPTRGIDVGSKAQVLSLLRELSRKGKGIVLVSSQLDELVSTCDRIAVLRGGELGAPRPASEWNEEALLLEASS